MTAKKGRYPRKSYYATSEEKWIHSGVVSSYTEGRLQWISFHSVHTCVLIVALFSQSRL